MKLYMDPLSTTTRAVRLFLFDNKIAVDEECIELFAGEHLTEAFAAINPSQQVPVLIDGDFKLTESSAILKYLAEKIGSPAYPTDIRARARVNEAMDWFSTGFFIAFCYFGVYTHMLPELTSLSATTRADLDHLGTHYSERYLNVLDRHMLNGRPFVCGDEITVADYLGATYVGLGAYIDFDFSRYPNIAAWLGRMRAREGWEPAYAAFNGFASAALAEQARGAA
ncbi:MAG: glutathione S-transferase family protein [Parvibaculum sp.]|uniref:glutathione S-transferase family protein n=1 Tax=Parvibaculum sp. TaxID=2024848 RepID=UPI003C720563